MTHKYSSIEWNSIFTFKKDNTSGLNINVYHWWWQFLVYLPIKSNALNSGKHLSLAISFMSVTLLPLMKRKTSYFVWSFHILSTVKFRTVCVLSLKRIQLKQLMLTCRRKTSPCISANVIYELEKFSNLPYFLLCHVLHQKS